jgi:hypothetical protein
LLFLLGLAKPSNDDDEEDEEVARSGLVCRLAGGRVSRAIGSPKTSFERKGETDREGPVATPITRSCPFVLSGSTLGSPDFTLTGV